MPNEFDATANPVRNLGKVQKFLVGADFEAYAEQLEFSFMANGVTNSKQKKAVLLTNLLTEMYQLSKDLICPDIDKRRFPHLQHYRRAYPKTIEAPETGFSRQV